MAGPILPFVAGHSPAAFVRAAGTFSQWLERRFRELKVILTMGAIAAGGFVAIISLMALIAGAAHAQDIGGVTVTAPDCRQPQNPAPACAAQRLNQAVKAAGASAKGAPSVDAPDVRSPAAAIGLGTPAAAAQQPGTPFGKAPGYVPPPPISERSGASPYARGRP